MTFVVSEIELIEAHGQGLRAAKYLSLRERVIIRQIALRQDP